MYQDLPKFQEEYSAKVPALTLLTNMGWSFLPPEQTLSARSGKTDEVVLRQILRSELKKRTFTFAGNSYPLSDKAIDNLIAEVCSPALNEGLLTANQQLYNHLQYGISVTEFVDGKKANPTIAMFIAKKIQEICRDYRINSVYVRMKGQTGATGIGPGAGAIVRTLTKEGMKILSMTETTRVARGGPKKKGGRRGRRP